MKDAAILTKYYKNYNYGGMLQGYALHKVITDMGLECDIISYDVSKNQNPVYGSLLHQCRQYGLSAFLQKVSEKIVGKFGFLIRDTLSGRKALFDSFIFNVVMRLNPEGKIANTIVDYKNKHIRVPNSKQGTN